MWDIEQAISLIQVVTRPISNAGCLVTFYGSVLTKLESKNDLDIIIIPKRKGIFVSEIIKAFNNIGFFIDDKRHATYYGVMGTESHILYNDKHQVIDLQIRELHKSKLD